MAHKNKHKTAEIQSQTKVVACWSSAEKAVLKHFERFHRKTPVTKSLYK